VRLQLLPWILGRGDAAGAIRGGRGLPLIGLWENVGQSAADAVGAASVAALLAGWVLPRNAALVWTAFVVLTIGLPALLPIFAAVVRAAPASTRRSHFRALRKDVWLAASLTCLPDNLLAHQSLADDRRDRSNAVSSIREPAEPAAVGHRSAGEPHAPA